uniref:Trypsin-like peptidase domain-containing protein n=1 Tax=Aegilops tauschii subsp. strangulata TaxID=200361 RepID=A0A453SRK3_AEGTS
MSVVMLQGGSPEHLGSGFVAYCNGCSCLVMTSYHVVESAFTNGLMVTVIFPGGQPRFQADVQNLSEPGDLAILQFNCEGHMFEPLLFAEISTNRDLFPWTVYLHGYYNGKRGQLIRPSTLPGQIDGMYVNQETGVHMHYANYTSNPGMSGGPIIMGGRVVGVNKGSEAGTRLAVSVLGVHTMLEDWAGGAETIAEMLEMLERPGY